MDVAAPRPLVSVIVPIFNVEPFLKECIDSIRNQTMRDIEIILVDDGSPDACPSMCDKFAAEDSRIRVHHQANAGVSAARNQGMEMAGADWLMFVDPDDWLEGNAVEVLYQKASQTQCEIVSASFFREYPERQEHVRFEVDGEREYLVQENLQFLFRCVVCYVDHGKEVFLGSVWKNIYRADYLRAHQARFSVELKSSEDMIFNLYAVWYAKKVCIMDVPIYHYRMRSHTYIPGQQERLLKIYSAMRTFMGKNHVQRELLPYYYWHFITNLIEFVRRQSASVHDITTFCAATQTLKEFVELPECKEAIICVNSSMLSVKRRFVQFFLKRRMYRTIIATCIVYCKLFIREEERY